MAKKIRKQVEVSVIIPVYGNMKALPEQLNHLRLAAANLPYNVYITDDLSPDFEEAGGKGFYEQLTLAYPEIVHIEYHKTNQGFPMAVNDSARYATGKYMFIMNSDVAMQPGSLIELYNAIEQDPKIGLVFPKLLFYPDGNDPSRPSGKIQHAGIVFDTGGQPLHIFVGWDADHPFTNIRASFNAATGAAMFIRSELFRRLKGFDPIFGKGTVEDLDLCFKIKMNGYDIVYIPEAIGFHFASASSTKYKTPFPIQQNMLILRQRYPQIPFDYWIHADGLGPT